MSSQFQEKKSVVPIEKFLFPLVVRANKALLLLLLLLLLLSYNSQECDNLISAHCPVFFALLSVKWSFTEG